MNQISSEKAKVKNDSRAVTSDVHRYPRLGLRESGWERENGRERYVSDLNTNDVKVFEECDFMGDMRPSKVERVLLEGESEKNDRKMKSYKRQVTKL